MLTLLKIKNILVTDKENGKNKEIYTFINILIQLFFILSVRRSFTLNSSLIMQRFMQALSMVPYLYSSKK